MKILLVLLSLGQLMAPGSRAGFEMTDGDDQLRAKLTFEHKGEAYTMRSTEADDLDHYRAIFGNPISMQKYMEGVPRSEEDIVRRHGRYHAAWQAKDPWSSYLVFQGDRFAGHVLLEPTDRPEYPYETELSYVFLPEFWRSGLGTASVGALINQAVIPVLKLKYKIKGHDISQIYATAREDNPGSWGILKNNGFAFESSQTKFGVVRQFYSRKV